jgi:hypothetical protein
LFEIIDPVGEGAAPYRSRVAVAASNTSPGLPWGGKKNPKLGFNFKIFVLGHGLQLKPKLLDRQMFQSDNVHKLLRCNAFSMEKKIIKKLTNYQ